MSWNPNPINFIIWWVILKATGKPYSNYLKKLKKIKEKEERAEYEKIPQHKLIMKKNKRIIHAKYWYASNNY